MIARDDFIFTVGYEGNTAIVNVKKKQAHRRLSTRELAEKGLLKEATSSAVYNKSAEELSEVLALYNENNEKKLDSSDALKRTFGVLESLDDIMRVLHI